MAKKTMTRRELVQLAGTATALGAVLGFSPARARAGEQVGQTLKGKVEFLKLEYLKYELKFFKGADLIYSHEVPENIGRSYQEGSLMTIKIFRGGKLLPNAWSWTVHKES